MYIYIYNFNTHIAVNPKMWFSRLFVCFRLISLTGHNMKRHYRIYCDRLLLLLSESVII